MSGIAVSVIVPFYRINCNLFSRCVSSLEKQTLEEIEFIFVSDGSPDFDAARPLIPDDARFRVIRLEKNGGVSNARNEGLKAARGAYAGFADCDDFMVPEMFEKLYSSAKSADADCAVCSFIKTDENGKRIPDRHVDSIQLPQDIRELDDVSLSRLFMPMQWSCWNKIFRNPHELVPFDTELKIAEDKLFVISNVLRCRRAAAINDRLYCYTQNSESVMMTSECKPYLPVLKDLIYSEERLLELFDGKFSGYEKTCRRFALDLVRTFIVSGYGKLSKSEFDEGRAMISGFLREHSAVLRRFLPFELKLWLCSDIFRSFSALWRADIKLRQAQMDKIR